MVYRIDNRSNRHKGRNIGLGILFGVILTIGVLVVTGNDKQPIIQKIVSIDKPILKTIGQTQPSQLSNTVKQESPSSNSKAQKNNVEQKQSTSEVRHVTYSLEELKKVALDDINNYRVNNGLNPISLGIAIAPQKYAQVLLQRGCINHISQDGLNPLGRYKASGDELFSVAENLSGGYGTDWMNPIESIRQADSEMMNNDADQGNAHRNNILNPNHISVSLGIAYDSDKLILVQDFEDQYAGDIYYYDNSDACW